MATNIFLPCEHHWFPFWTDRTKFVIEWFCYKCKTWTQDPEGEKRS